MSGCESSKFKKEANKRLFSDFWLQVYKVSHNESYGQLNVLESVCN